MPRPKNAFQSPGTQSLRPECAGIRGHVVDSLPAEPSGPRVRSLRQPIGAAQSIGITPSRRPSRPGHGVRKLLSQALEEVRRRPHEAEDAALRLDHLEGRLLELGEVRGDAVLEDEGVVAPVVRLAHARLDADLGGHAADDELPDATGLEDRVHVRGVERALARLVDDRLAGDRVDLVDDVVAVLAADQQPAHRALVADVDRGPAALVLRGRAGRTGPPGGPRGCG